MKTNLEKIHNDLEDQKSVNDGLKEENKTLEDGNKTKDESIKNLEEKTNKLEKDLQAKKEREKKKKEATIQVASADTSTSNNTVVSRSGSSSAPGKTYMMEATAYTAYCNGCSGITRTGINLRKNPNAKVIAVDPSVIPLGSKVYVEGYGHAIAGDTGGDIKGNRIDLHMTTKDQAYSFGRRTVSVKVLD